MKIDVRQRILNHLKDDRSSPSTQNGGDQKGILEINHIPMNQAHSQTRNLRWCWSVLGLMAGLLLWLPLRALALDPDQDLNQYICQTWDRQNGLPVNAVNEIVQTADGYLWLGTAAGLLRFDGKQFTPMQTHQGTSSVTSLTTNSLGGLWVSLNQQGFTFYDGRDVLVPAKTPPTMPGLSCSYLHQDAKGTLWVLAASEIGRLTTLEKYEKLADIPQNRAICGYQDSQGRFWYGTLNQGLYYWQSGQIHHLSDPDLDEALIITITEDHAGNLWVGTANGLFSFDSQLKRKNIPPLYNEVRALLVDSHGVLWIGTSQQGLARFRHGQYEFLRRTDGLASNYIRSLAEDREGSLWIGTRSGLNQLEDVKFPTYPASEISSALDGICVYPARQGGIWVGSTVGLTLLNGSPKTFGTEAGLTDRLVKRILETRNGDLYLDCGSHDLDIFSKGRVIASYTMTNLMAGLVEDERGVVMSVGGDLYRVGTNYLTPYPFASNQIPPMWWINDLAPGRDGSFWVASVNGIFQIKDGTYQHWTTDQGLTDNHIGWLLEDKDGVVWATMPTGIARLKDNQISCLSETKGLFDNNVLCVIPDEAGNLWVDAGRGLSRISRASLDAWVAGRTNQVDCKAYDGSSSIKLTDKTFQEQVGCRSRDGRIWFPSSLGVEAIDPSHILTNLVSPPVHLLNIIANGRKYPLGAPLVIPPGPGQLEFDFDALSFISPQKTSCRYRLVGFDADWVEAGPRRQAFYTNLKPGHYSFRVIAANADGVWNLTGESVNLKLEPHYYETAWFFAGMVALLASLLVLAGHAQRRRESRQDRLTREARAWLETQVHLRTAELANERELLRTLLKNCPDRIYFKDAQSRFIKYSEPMAQFFGSNAPDALAGKSDFDLFKPEHAHNAYEEEQAIIRTGQPVIGKIEHEIWLDDRPDSWVLTTKMPYRNPEGKIIGTFGISKDITPMVQAEAKLKEVHQQLLEISRQAGMAEVATNVLHNVGNVLNSVNVSADLVLENTKKSKAPWVGRLADLLEAHAADLAGFLSTDPQGRQIPEFLKQLAGQLVREQQTALQELELLRHNVEHIKDIVARQQSYSKISGITEVIPVRKLVEDALIMNAGAMARHKIELVREYVDVPPLNVEKHKVLEILINLIRNAKIACDESRRPDKQIHIQIARTGDSVHITITDNGVGIPPENLNRLFNHGFTTRPGGHGFGLHSCALAARELGGTLTVHSDGSGQGAAFTLTLPISTPVATN